MGDCQNYGPFLGPYYNTGPNTGPNLGDPKRDHNFDNLPFVDGLRKDCMQGAETCHAALGALGLCAYVVLRVSGLRNWGLRTKTEGSQVCSLQLGTNCFGAMPATDLAVFQICRPSDNNPSSLPWKYTYTCWMMCVCIHIYTYVIDSLSQRLQMERAET